MSESDPTSINEKPIWFYEPTDPYGEFSNYSPHPFFLGGKWWPTAEHYYQAKKFEGTPNEDIGLREAENERIFEPLHPPLMLASCTNNKTWSFIPLSVFSFASLDVRTCSKDPTLVKAMAAQPWRLVRTDWEAVMENVMLDGLMAKFSQNPSARAVLMNTGERPLVQHTKTDSYWGDGGDGNGHNRLGVLLQQVRNHFRENPGALNNKFTAQLPADWKIGPLIPPNISPV